MILRCIIYIFFIYISLVSCSKDIVKKSTIKETNLESQMIEAYQEGLKELKRGDVIFAAKKFNEAELLFPQSKWAAKSALMASYSYFLQGYYTLAIENIKRYIKTYPKDKNKPYAHYLLAMCYYETIEGEKKI